MNADLTRVAHEVAALLKEKNETVCVAETAAGGLVSSALLSYPGASKIYAGGLTLYTLPSRVAFAGWTQTDIDEYRGPTVDVVSKIADNVRFKLEATYCVCESGTAGPTGGKNRLPGSCALAVSTSGQTYSKTIDTGLGTNREANMIAFAKEALLFLQEVLVGQATPPGQHSLPSDPSEHL